MKKRLSQAMACLLAAISVSAQAASAYNMKQYAPGMASGSAGPAKTGVVQNSGYRAWEDGTVAASCQAYILGDATHAYTGATGDGIYRVNVNGTPSNVYCDMTSDGGGWMLALYANTVTAADDYFIRDVMVKGYPLKTVSENTAAYPVLPTGLTNNFSQVLHKGGTTSWQNKMGAWVRWSTVASFPLSTTLPGAKTASGLTSLYLSGIAWGYSTAQSTDWLILWDAPGISPICGGNGVAAPKNCPTYAQYAWTDMTTQPHFDTSSARQLYVR